jgi:hypothetical protein
MAKGSENLLIRSGIQQIRFFPDLKIVFLGSSSFFYGLDDFQLKPALVFCMISTQNGEEPIFIYYLKSNTPHFY